MIRKEIVLPATRDDVWDALTDEDRLEEWFANDVELDLRPGRRRELPLVERRGAPRDGDRGGAGAAARLRLGGRGHGRVHARRRRRRHAARRRGVVAGVVDGDRAPGVRASRLSDPLGQVFGALADPSRRQVIGYLSARGTATATELTGELPMTRQAVAKHLATLADAGLVESERQGRETRFRLTDAGAEWDDRLDALRSHLTRRPTMSLYDAVRDLPLQHRGLPPRAARARGGARVHAAPHRRRAVRRRRGGPRRGGRLRPARAGAVPGRRGQAALPGRAHARLVLAPAGRPDRVPALGVRVGRARPRAPPGGALARRSGRPRAAAAPVRRLDAHRERSRAGSSSTPTCSSSSTRTATGRTR